MPEPLSGTPPPAVTQADDLLLCQAATTSARVPARLVQGRDAADPQPEQRCRPPGARNRREAGRLAEVEEVRCRLPPFFGDRLAADLLPDDGEAYRRSADELTVVFRDLYKVRYLRQDQGLLRRGRSLGARTALRACRVRAGDA